MHKVQSTPAPLSLLALFPPSKRYLIGVSGGRDSVALFHRLCAEGYRRLIVCHLDHRLRGRTGKTDARFVARLAAGAGLICELGETDVQALAREAKQSIETAGRAARYQFFAKVARRRRCHVIFLAHHADDLVETFLMNLFRGAATSGLRGISPVSVHTVAETKLQVVRPLLETTRAEIDSYIRQRALRYREDASNQDLAPLRNRIRRRIIPYIEKQMGRKVRTSVWRAAIVAAAEDACLKELLDREHPVADELEVARLRPLSLALQRRILHRWLQSHAIPDLDFELIERLRALLDPSTTHARINLPRAAHACRRAGKIFVERSGADRPVPDKLNR
ncbi:MAG: tRNA lysidine(34) synthetase TilS [Verrucomicrobiota bacterium]